MRKEAEAFILSVATARAFADSTYPTDMTREDFVARRTAQIAEIRSLIRNNDAFLEAYLGPLEQKDRLTPVEKAELNEFAQGLNTGLSAADDGLLLRICTVLYRDAMAGDNLNEQVRAIYYRAYYEYAVIRMSTLLQGYRGFEEIRPYADMYDLLTREGKSFFMRCWCNQLLESGLTTAQKREIVDFVRDKQQEEPDSGLPYDAYYLAMYRNIKNLYHEMIRNDWHRQPNTPETVALAREASDYIHEHMMNMKSSPRANRLISMLAYEEGRFYSGEIDLKDLLDRIRDLSVIREDYNLLEKSTVYFKAGLAAVEFKRVYDKNVSTNEIYNLFRERLEQSVAFMHSLKPSEINSSIAAEYSGYLGKMAEFLRYDQVQPYFEEAMRTRSKALYVHTMTVAELCVCLCRALLQKRPDYFIGIYDCATAGDVAAREKDLLNTAWNMGIFHDIGITRQTDVKEIFHRSRTEKEREALHAHPVTGIMGKDSSFPEILRECIRSHHTAYNGSGYPEGCAPGRNAPLVHILYYANDLEAATNQLELHEKEPVTPAEFMRQAEALSGTIYAPAVVETVAESPALRAEMEALLGEKRNGLAWKTYTERT